MPSPRHSSNSNRPRNAGPPPSSRGSWSARARLPLRSGAGRGNFRRLTISLMRRRKTGGTILISRMNRFRLALILAVGGFAVKGGAVVVYPLLHPPVLLGLLTTHDPPVACFADTALPLFFYLS